MNCLPTDTCLPNLANLFEHSILAAGFNRCQFAHPNTHTHVEGCATIWQIAKRQHLHYQPAIDCTAIYTLCQTKPQFATQSPIQSSIQTSIQTTIPTMIQTIGVAHCCPEGLFFRPYYQDTQFPFLQQAADPANMLQRLTAILQVEKMCADSLQITPIRYRPADRCVLRYTYHAYTPQGEPASQHIFGKLFHSPNLQRLAALPLLYTLCQQNAALPKSPRTLGYDPDLHLLLQADVQGTEMHTAVFDPAIPIRIRIAWFAQMGAKIAALHQLPLLDLPCRTMRENLADLVNYLPIMERFAPRLANQYEAVLDALHKLDPAWLEEGSVVCHGALRTDQFLLNRLERDAETDAELTLIDLDTLCLSHPACDLANCLAYLQWKAIRQPQYAALIQQAIPAFLAGYTAVRSLPRPEAMAVYQAISLLKIAGRRFPNLSYQEWSLTPELVQTAYEAILKVSMYVSNRVKTSYRNT